MVLRRISLIFPVPGLAVQPPLTFRIARPAIRTKTAKIIKSFILIIIVL